MSTLEGESTWVFAFIRIAINYRPFFLLRVVWKSVLEPPVHVLPCCIVVERLKMKESASALNDRSRSSAIAGAERKLS